jgi:hypothetical protein
MIKFCSFAMVGLLMLSVSSFSFSQEKGGKKGGLEAQAVAQLMKSLEKAELTEEQSTKIKEMYLKVATEVVAKRKDAGITAEMMKKRQEASKAAREAGKKGKEMAEATLTAMGLTDDQKKVFSETEEALNKAKIEVGKLLSAEQMAKLPEQAQNSLKAKEGKKGKAK